MPSRLDRCVLLDKNYHVQEQHFFHATGKFWGVHPNLKDNLLDVLTTNAMSNQASASAPNQASVSAFNQASASVQALASAPNQASVSTSGNVVPVLGASKPSFAVMAGAAKPQGAKPKPTHATQTAQKRVPIATYGTYKVYEIPKGREELKVKDYVVTKDLKLNKPIVLRVTYISAPVEGVRQSVQFENGLPGRLAFLDNYCKTYHPCVMMFHVPTKQRGYVFDMEHKNNKTRYSVRMNGANYYPTDDNMKGFQIE